MIRLGDTTKWNEDNGEELRYRYDLDKNSLIVDIGASKGVWVTEMTRRYNCFSIIYEPTILFQAKEGSYRGLFNRAAAWVYYGKLTLGTVAGEASYLNPSDDEYDCVDIADSLSSILQHNECIDLMKINIEGGEYVLLPHLINNFDIKRIKNIQVQFHIIGNYEDCFDKYTDILLELSNTHKLTWNYDFVWCNFALK